MSSRLNLSNLGGFWLGLTSDSPSPFWTGFLDFVESGLEGLLDLHDLFRSLIEQGVNLLLGVRVHLEVILAKLDLFDFVTNLVHQVAELLFWGIVRRLGVLLRAFG